MRKQMKRMAAGFMAASLMVAVITTGGMAYAADKAIGSAGALADSEYSIEEMLVYAITDEYLAQAEYNAILEKYGVQRPFSNIVQAEATHISLLLPLLEEYKIVVPETDLDSMATVPDSIEAAYEIGVVAEQKNIAMYESFLKEELPEDVKEVFERLMSASQNHLSAFQNAESGNCIGGNQQNGNANNSGRGKGFGQGQGKGQGNCGNRNNSQGSCIL